MSDTISDPGDDRKRGGMGRRAQSPELAALRRAVRAARDTTGRHSLTMLEYDAWRAEQLAQRGRRSEQPIPRATRIREHFGSWRKAVRAALGYDPQPAVTLTRRPSKPKSHGEVR